MPTSDAGLAPIGNMNQTELSVNVSNNGKRFVLMMVQNSIPFQCLSLMGIIVQIGKGDNMASLADHFGNPVLAKEFLNHLNGKYNLRLYYTKEKGNFKGKFRWHFGYPEQIIKPLLPLLETTPFWADQHWFESDGYYIYFLPIMTDTANLTESLVVKLRFEDKVLLGLYNDCISAYRRWYDIDKIINVV